MAAGEPGTESGRTKRESSRRVPSSGGFSMTISVRESGMPQTVSKNSPSTNVLPSTSRPSDTKKVVTASRSATVRPTWSKRRTCDIGPSSRRRIDRASATVGVLSTSRCGTRGAGPARRELERRADEGRGCHGTSRSYPRARELNTDTRPSISDSGSQIVVFLDDRRAARLVRPRQGRFRTLVRRH
jgi:hypothetical protein